MSRQPGAWARFGREPLRHSDNLKDQEVSFRTEQPQELIHNNNCYGAPTARSLCDTTRQQMAGFDERE